MKADDDKEITEESKKVKLHIYYITPPSNLQPKMCKLLINIDNGQPRLKTE